MDGIVSKLLFFLLKAEAFLLPWLSPAYQMQMMPRSNSTSSKLLFPTLWSKSIAIPGSQLSFDKGAIPGTAHLLTWVFSCFTSSQHLHSWLFAGLSLQRTSSQVTHCMDFRGALLQIIWEKHGKQKRNKNGS